MAGKSSAALMFLALALSGTIGCDTKQSTKPVAGAATTGDDDHAHVHDHAEHGPHGGHMLHLEPDGVHAEWAHDDDTKTITVYLDEVTKPASDVKFEVKVGDTEPQSFPLTKAEGGTGGGTWSISSDALMTHLNMGEAAKVQLIVSSDDKQMTSTIEHSDEQHHH